MPEHYSFKGLLARFLAIVVSIVLFYLVLYLFPFSFIPDLLLLSENGNIASYLSTIMSSVSSLSGLLIAILVIAFEYYKSNLNKIYLRYFIRNRYLISLVVLYIFVFIFTGMSLWLLKGDRPVTSGEISVSYVSIVSFLVLIPLTFSYSFLLIKSLNVNDIINEYVEKLDFDDIFLLNINNKIFPARKDREKDVPITQIVDEDSLNVVHKLVLNELRTENVIKAQVVLNRVLNKFQTYLLAKKEEEIRTDTSLHQIRFAHFLVTIVSQAREFGFTKKLVFNRSLEIAEELYKSYNRKGYKLAYLEPFRIGFYTKLLEVYSNKGVSRKKILNSIEKIINDVLSQNLPPEVSIVYLNPDYRKIKNIDEEDIRSEFRKEDSAHRHSWEKFMEKYPLYFVEEMNAAIVSNDEKYFLEILSIFRGLTFSWKWLDNEDTNFLKSQWIVRNFLELVMIYKSAIERGVIFDVKPYDLFSGSEILDLYENDEVCARKILVEYLQFLLWLNRKEKLTYDLFYGVFSIGDFGRMYGSNSLTKLGTFFANKYHEAGRYQEGFSDVVTAVETIFDDLKKGVGGKEVTFKRMLYLLEEIKESYLFSRKGVSKSQRLLRKLNGLKRKIDTVAH